MPVTWLQHGRPLVGGRKPVCTLQGSRACSFPGQVGFAGEQGFQVMGAVSGSQDPLCGMLAAGRVQVVEPLSLLVLSPDPEPKMAVSLPGWRGVT